MTDYTQANRPMWVETELGEDVLLLEGFNGREAMSEPFLFRLDLLSEDPAIDGESVLRTNVGVGLTLPDGETRWIHGVVRRFVQLRRDHDLTAYRAEIVPWLWFLSLARDCRIFQEKDALDIVEEVFNEQGYADFEIRCIRSYRKREYCVQYRETNLDFVTRLLEEEGIFYFFEHTEDKHVLVLADDMTSIKPCEGQPQARVHSQTLPDEDVLLEIEREYAAHAGQVTLADYDYLQPSLHLMTSVHGGQPEEVYDFPGNFDDLEDGDRNARLALEREEALRQVVRGESTCRAFHSGGRFQVMDHFSSNGNHHYALIELRHRAKTGQYRAGSEDDALDYRNEFLAIPHEVPFRPARRTGKPAMRGAQTAVVVGPSGEELWTDEFGRVKIQFHWDRLGSRNENSSCWVRVTTPWGSKGFGSVAVPRIGDEVVVDFLEGDPDRPIIVGSVYNAERMPPFEFPAQQAHAGMRSHSVKGDGTKFSEIRFDDEPGEERLVIHAEKDHHVVVENNEYHTVQGTAVLDYGGVKIKAGDLGVGGGAGSTREPHKKPKYRGYDADYGAVYSGRAGLYYALYGSAMSLYGNYVVGHVAYTGLYGMKNELGGLYMTAKAKEISETKMLLKSHGLRIDNNVSAISTNTNMILMNSAWIAHNQLASFL